MVHKTLLANLLTLTQRYHWKGGGAGKESIMKQVNVKLAEAEKKQQPKAEVFFFLSWLLNVLSTWQLPLRGISADVEAADQIRSLT